MASTDPALWTTRRAFGVAGGPDEVVLTEEGAALAFSVGAQVRRGKPAQALEALFEACGFGLLTVYDGPRARLTPLGLLGFDAWAYLRSRGLVEAPSLDSVKLTDAGQAACKNGFAERERLLERCRFAARETTR